MRKKLVKGLMMAMVLVTLGTTNVNAKPRQNIKQTRTMMGQIVDISPKDNLVYILTKDGNLWYLVGTEDHMIGDVVKVKFDTRKTKKVQDDKIKKVTYKYYCDYMVFGR